MLGRGYAGYFRLRDDGALARLLDRASRDEKYYRRLKRAVQARRGRFAPAAEGSEVRRLTRELGQRAERLPSRRD